jgi:hypothetical protein
MEISTVVEQPPSTFLSEERSGGFFLGIKPRWCGADLHLRSPKCRARGVMRIEEETTRFPLRLGIGLYARSVQANGAVRQDRKMIDVAFGHMSHDDLIFQNLSFEVSLWHLLIPLDPKPLTSQIKKASEFDLISLIGRPHEERSSAVFNDLQSKRRKIVEFEKRKY